MQSLLGTDPAVFIAMTLMLFGFIAAMAGSALARTWRPAWQALAYAVPLAAVDRFLIYGLFQGTLLSASGYLLDLAAIALFASASYRLTRAHLMVRQYPWLYERAGPFGWRDRREG